MNIQVSLGRTTKCDQNHISGIFKFGHTLKLELSMSFCSTNQPLTILGKLGCPSKKKKRHVSFNTKYIYIYIYYYENLSIYKPNGSFTLANVT